MIAVVGSHTPAIEVAWSASDLVLVVLFKLFLTPGHVRSEVKLCCHDHCREQKTYCMCNMTT